MENGKETVINKLLSKNKSDYIRLTSFTTRPKRSDETEGEEFSFVSERTFNALDGGNILMGKKKLDGYSYRDTSIRYGYTIS